MIRPALSALALTAAMALSGCATAPGPVEVTRFVDPAAIAQLGQGTIFIQAAPGEDANSLEMSAYTAAVAAELRALGYVETDRASADQIAEVRAARYEQERYGRGGSGVNVGVGGSTGSYGSGVGVGVGINLGGGGARDRVGTEMGVIIRDKSTGQSLWEGRAEFEAPENSPLAQRTASAQRVAAALFSEFPGNNGETVEVEVP